MRAVTWANFLGHLKLGEVTLDRIAAAPGQELRYGVEGARGGIHWVNVNIVPSEDGVKPSTLRLSHSLEIDGREMHQNSLSFSDEEWFAFNDGVMGGEYDDTAGIWGGVMNRVVDSGPIGRQACESTFVLPYAA